MSGARAGRLAGRSVLVVAARLAGAGIALGIQASVARLWGAEALGTYTLAIAAAGIAAAALPLGFGTIGGYFAAEYTARGAGAPLRRFVLRAYGHVAAGTALLALVLPGLRAGGADAAALPWGAALLLAVAIGAVHVSGSVLIGMGRPVMGFAADALLRPAALVIGLGVALAAGGGARLGHLLWTAGLLYAAVALAHGLLLGQALRSLPAGESDGTSEARRWWRFAPPWVVITLATDFFFDIDLLLLAPLLDRETLATFGVAARLFSLAAFAVGTIYAIALPDLAAAGLDAARRDLAARTRETNLLACAASLGGAAAALVGGPLIALVFGPAFAEAAVPLAILCLGLAIRSALGPGSLLLSLNDQPWAALPAAGLGLAVLGLGNLILAPAFGLMGVAWAASIAMAAGAGALWLTALRRTGIDVSLLAGLRRATPTVT